MTKKRLLIILTLLLLVPIFIFIIDMANFIFKIQCIPCYSLGKQMFENRNTMWTALTGLFTLIGIITSSLWFYLDQKEKELEKKKQIIAGIILEIQKNLDYLYSTIVENHHLKPEFEYLYLLKKNLYFIQDINRFNKLNNLYKELKWFEEIYRANYQKHFELGIFKIEIFHKYMLFVFNELNFQCLNQEDFNTIYNEKNINNYINYLEIFYINEKSNINNTLDQYVRDIFENK